VNFFIEKKKASFSLAEVPVTLLIIEVIGWVEIFSTQQQAKPALAGRRTFEKSCCVEPNPTAP